LHFVLLWWFWVFQLLLLVVPEYAKEDKTNNYKYQHDNYNCLN